MTTKRETITPAEIELGDECYWFVIMKLGSIPSLNEAKKIGGVVAAIAPDDTYDDDGLKVWFKKDTEIAVDENDHWIESYLLWPSLEVTRVIK